MAGVLHWLVPFTSPDRDVSVTGKARDESDRLRLASPSQTRRERFEKDDGRWRRPGA